MGDNQLPFSRVGSLNDQKIVCSPSYVDIRSRVNTTRGLDFDHMIKGEHTWEI
jgi:hypothetical protein